MKSHLKTTIFCYLQYLPPTVIETGERLAALRTVMTNEGIQAYIIPTEDSHQVRMRR